jgi:two-component system sensor histidine kinase PilS (NtrC family)
MEEFRVKLYWLMGLRVAAVTLLLGLSLALPLVKGSLAILFSILIVFTYGLTLVYAVTLQSLSSRAGLIRLCSVQLGMDLVLESLLVAATGGVSSPFSVLYVITIPLASVTVGRWAGLVAGGAAVILFGLVAELQLLGSVDPLGWLSPGHLSLPETFHTFGVHALAFLIVGLLSGRLAENLRQAGQSLVEQEKGLRQLQAFHENVVQSISSGLFTTDSNGCITSFNPAAQEATGYTSSEAAGRFWGDIFNWQQDTPSMPAPMSLAGPHRFEAVGKRADGSRVVVGMTVSPLTEQGVQIGLVGVFKDLTKIRDMEEEMQRREWLATLGEMSAGMAHEIRNPLAAVGGAMQMLRRDLTLDATGSRLMDIAIRETGRLDDIIKAFLTYARPPALNLKECDVNAILSETLDLIRPQAAMRKGLSIETALATGTLIAQVDPDQMKQVFWNLATNAFQAMPAGGRLTVSTGRRHLGSGECSGDIVEVVFHDTGDGIAKENLDKIFYPFFTTKAEGSGLGLPTVHRIVDLHGGWIRVQSEQGCGARFVVCVPQEAGIGPRLRHEDRESWSRGPWKKF